ncbi:phosphotransferase, partial [bacterium]|nr:phosphotransferase [bacterium]
DDGTRRHYYVLQRINRDVFKRPDLVMENVARVCDHARFRLLESGVHEADRRALRLVPTTTTTTGDGDGCPDDDGGGARRPPWHVVDDSGEYWRCYHRVPNATGHDVASSTDRARSAAMAYGRFQSLLADLPPPPPGGERRRSLHETIPGFHDTPRRFEAFRSAIADDVLGRASSASAEIEFALARERDSSVLVDALRRGTIPERVAHNDAKMGNVLLDDDTDAGVCVVDLDTVMPGTVLYDFGDLVRTCTSPAPEDEIDLSRVRMRFEVFEALVDGYLESTRDFLTETERSMMPFSGKLITFEIGLRFLTDYLGG